MDKPKAFVPERAFAARNACGRSTAEQIDDIRKYGNHGASQVLRNATLAAGGVRGPRQTAGIGVFLGCYRPFTTPGLVRDALKLLDILGADYTFYDKEYCCGLPLLMADPDAPREGLAAAGEFTGKNLDLARQNGATSMAYCCLGCAYMARHTLAGSGLEQAFILDVILDHLGDQTLKVAPTVTGYFQGCQTFYQAVLPGVSFDFDRYRQVLDRIEGLTVVDLPHTLCCKKSSDKLVERAVDMHLDKLVCACGGCSVALREAGRGKLAVRTLPELLLESLTPA